MPLKYKILVAMKIEKVDNGCGMDGGVKGEGRTFRDYGIVVNLMRIIVTSCFDNPLINII